MSYIINPCPICDNKHLAVEVNALTLSTGDITKYATCPTTREPILFTDEQVEALVKMPSRTDFETPKEYRDAVMAIRMS